MPTDVKTEEAPRRQEYLDALRGYAILGVMIVHTGGTFHELIRATAWGARGVQLFFVVSAITLAGSWQDRREKVWAFYVRRLFRIAPMFWLAIVFYAGIQSGPGTFKAWQILLTSLFLHGFHPET